ncbi:MAG: sulfotransferase domain-containing protein [Patescibacteria group bacterium]|nr:sulfotransferase domain-containing protein [Patescibacteria group bacterium]
MFYKKKIIDGKVNSLFKRIFGLNSLKLKKYRNYKNSPFCMVATMPRSGTWMAAFFFHAYNAYLNNDTLINDNIPHFNFYNKINISKYHAHTIFPDFYKIYFGNFRSRWDDLSFYVSGYNYGYPFLKANRNYFSPIVNSNVRIVYIYRNPLDQAVSFFRHIRYHKDKKHQYATINGKTDFLKNEIDFLKKVGLNSYLKQFLTYYLLKHQYRKNLMMLSYEDILKYPERAFKDILLFFCHKIDTDKKKKSFNDAIKFISMDNLKSFEKNLGHSFGDDQQSTNESHMRGGKIGKWKNFFDQNIIDYTEDKLQKFNISLDYFTIE